MIATLLLLSAAAWCVASERGPILRLARLPAVPQPLAPDPAATPAPAAPATTSHHPLMRRLPDVPPGVSPIRRLPEPIREKSPGPDPLRAAPELSPDPTPLRTAQAPEAELPPDAELSQPEAPPVRPEADVTAAPPHAEELSAFPTWWHAPITASLSTLEQQQPITLDGILLDALRYSPRVQALADLPLIRETAIVEAAAGFDTRNFVDSRFNSISDPVGNTLTTGGPPRYREQNLNASAGLRKRTRYGGDWELSQKLGGQTANSLFFVPKHQSNARLSLSFTQPLLRGSGETYNNSLIVLAELDTAAGRDQVLGEIQDHLRSVSDAYWRIHLGRAVLVQRLRSVERAQAILQELEQRSEVDTMRSQIARARSAVSSRRADLARAEADVQNAEARLRALVNSPDLQAGSQVELIPVDIPLSLPLNLQLEDAYVTALQNRTEIDEAMKAVQASRVRLGMSENEMRPLLDMVVESYLAGLAGDYDSPTAFGDQFSKGQPGFTAGLLFEMPWQNRAAIARAQRRKLELRQATAQLREVLITYQAEVEIAVRNVDAAYRELQGRYSSMQAVVADIGFMEERWRLLPGDDRSRGFLLDDLLLAQERLATEERAFALAQVQYTLSLIDFRRATGTLVRMEQLAEIQAYAEEAPLPEQLQTPVGELPTGPHSFDGPPPQEVLPPPSVVPYGSPAGEAPWSSPPAGRLPTLPPPPA